ncbi:MAG: aldehyde ferredoxin oxidoreductase family protein [Thermodesulfobacteriota bacterium]|nr:aldehyde ferredoxin oxidoreductase family protein [Thermodesulfobacteriota bacterium]
MKGYTGKILRVDLSKGRIETEALDETLAKKFIGGSGLGAKILHDETGPETDPLGPENRLIFMTGPFAATPVITSGRHAVVTKSPLTGIFAESDSGGTWGPFLKRAGFDGIVVLGKSAKPVYLWISDGKAEIRDAAHLWGKDTYELDGLIRNATKDEAVVASIGPAGEKGVRYASIMNDGQDGRAAGRGGTGAVMGSKNLKAIAVHGSLEMEIADPESLRASLKEISPMVAKNAEGMRKNGTAGGVATFEALGSLPLQNWKYQGRWEQGAAKIAGPTMTEKILTGIYHCEKCVIGCGRRVKIDKGPYAGVEGAGPEYETIALIGSLCLVDDLEAIAKANEICNRYGMDTISCGAAIAFAMEAYEKGLITTKDTGGIELLWGRGDVVVNLVEKIGKREGLGQLLGEGVRIAAEKIGRNAVEYSLHVKGMEIPGHDPRCYNAGAVSYATSNRGACHLAGFSHTFERVLSLPEIGVEKPLNRLEVQGKGELAASTQNVMGLFDSLKLCKFILFGGVKLTPITSWYTMVTGLPMDVAEFLKTGERIFNLKRLYNVRCGISRKDDVLPARFLTLQREGEGLTPNLPPLGEILSQYYQVRGWSEEGIPLPEKLKELGL